MNRRMIEDRAASSVGIDLELVARRILKLAEIAMLDHMEALDRSQAEGIAGDEGQDGRRMCPGQ